MFSGLSEEEYFKLQAVSNSRLQPLLKSPAHCKWAMDHPSEPTAAMVLGSAVDCLVFTPKQWNERFAVAEQCDEFTQKGTRCSFNGAFRFHNETWRCSAHAKKYAILNQPDVGFTTLTPDQSSTAYAMAKAVLNHPGASVLLAACEEFQLSLVWRENNLLCKGRLDGLSSELKTVIDLKTCADASLEAFSRKIADLSYHRQAAMYLRGCSFHGIEAQNYVIIAVENEPPHVVALYTLTERPFLNTDRGSLPTFTPVEYGNRELLRLLDLFERCEATGIWEGYPAQPMPISLPGWVMARMERAS